MSTITINNTTHEISFRTSSEMRTIAGFSGKMYMQGLSCNVYDILNNSKELLLILSSIQDEILKSATLISIADYEEIAGQYDPYHAGLYHTLLLEACGAINMLEAM